MQPIRVSDIRPERLDAFRWRLPRVGPMRTDGLVYAGDALFEAVRDDPALVQVCNVATLPGIAGPSIAMPDIHWGYGFPIGGVAAFDAEEGVVSPGGVGFDISCGVRLLRTGIEADELRASAAGAPGGGRTFERLVEALFEAVPSGVGRGAAGKLSARDLEGVVHQGAGWAVEHGRGAPEDLESLEDRGCMGGADASAVSDRARERGAAQLGTLGSGNHFLELQRVDQVRDAQAAQVLGLEEGALAILIHTGSRGFGYQVCEDHVREMVRAAQRYGIELPDRQLACAPLGSPEADHYLRAMACAANYARANRQVITQHVREVFERVYRRGPDWHRISVVYDVCHNLAKPETHGIEGRERRVVVHRKGATRAFPPGHRELPARYRAIGQPVLVPGDMGRYSFVLCANPQAAEQAFASSCHGAGRVLSRKRAKERARGRNLEAELAASGVIVRSEGRATVAEEMPEAYKDVAGVVDSVAGAGLARIVARLRPLAVIKG